MNARTNNTVSLIETLEARQMMSANPLGVSNVNGQLLITGTDAADNIIVSLAKGGLKVTNGAWNTTVKGTFKSITVKAGLGNDKVTIDAAVKTPANLFGGEGNDTLNGGAGDDRLFGQGGADSLSGNAGADLLVNVGDNAADKAFGGKGIDSFWTDAARTDTIGDAVAAEIAGGTVHRVGTFFGGSTVAARKAVKGGLNTVDLADPIAEAAYKNYSNNPLFATNGPTADDISQGYVGDCWFLSTLSSIARTNADAIKQSVTELGDGTYAVQFTNEDGTKAFVRVDGDLATASWGGLQYAALGKQNSVWVAIMEKAYASFREAGQSNYATLDGGWMSEAFGDLGFGSNDIWNVNSGNDLLTQIANELKAGKAVTMAINTPAAGAALIGSHAYSVVAVETDAKGNRTLVLRNPWGIDGAGSDGKDDGYVRVTATQAYQSFWGVISANVG